MAKKRSKRKIYTGELAKPIPHIPLPGISLKALTTLKSGEEFDAEMKERIAHRNERVNAAQWEKMCALFEYYEIELSASLDSWMRMCVALADAHVPGYRMARAPVGARTKWTAFDTGLLRVHILRTAEQHQCSIEEGARMVAATGIWDSKLKPTNRNPAETLSREGKRADPKMVNMLNNAFDYSRQVTAELTVDDYVREFFKASETMGK